MPNIFKETKIQIKNNVKGLLGNLYSIRRGRVFILNGHYLSRRNLPSKVFEKLIRKLSNEVDFLDIESAILISKNEEELIKIDKKRETYIAFTFDDGFEECYTKLAPVLQKYSVDALFFINPNFIKGNKNVIEDFLKNKYHVSNKRPLSINQIKEMKQNGFSFGSHTNDHLELTENLSKEMLEYQIVKSKYSVSLLTQGRCDYFAWPYGNFKHITEEAKTMALDTYEFIFASDPNVSTSHKRIINRFHFEGDYTFNHLKYILK